MAGTKRSLMVISLFFPLAFLISTVQDQASFSPFVDSEGNILLPSEFRMTFVHLGTWVLTSQPTPPGTTVSPTSHLPGIHAAYTQPESLNAYKKTGRWPDGTVVIQEVGLIMWDDTPPGHQMYAGDSAQWFVMIRDRQGRFKDNPNWGNGWGWAFFKASDRGKNFSADCRKDCLGCHDSVKETDYVYVQGYSALR